MRQEQHSTAGQQGWSISEADAAVLAAPFYHPAAEALILEAANAPSPERRERSRRALHVLNPDVALVEGLDLGEPCPEWALALGHATVEISLYLAHGLNRREREHVARLLSALCREAQRVRKLREVEAAA